MDITIGQLSAATVINSADLFLTEQSGISKQVSVPVLASGLSTISGFKILRNYIDGLICSNGTDTEHDIDIGMGEASDSTNNYNLVLSSTITKQIDATWAVGTNAGGLDTGTVASSLTYYIWLIKKDSDNSIDALFSLSDTSPTMPSGYTYKRKIMSIITDSSANIINFVQIGDKNIFNQPINNRALSAISSTNQTAYISTSPPLMEAIINLVFTVSNEGAEYFWFGNENRINISASATNYDVYLYSTAVVPNIVTNIKTDASSNFYARGSGTDIRFGYWSLGWIDDRGKNK